MKRFLVFFFLCSLSVCADRILPVDSIAYMRILEKPAFDKRFPGKVVTSAAEVPAGWYVRYQHESLVYLFGASASETTANFYADELREIFQDALAQRSSLSTARMEVLQYPVVEKKNPSQQSPDKNPAEKESPPEKTPPAQPSNPSPPKPSFWDWLFSIFS